MARVKAGLAFGAAYGEGELIENGKPITYYNSFTGSWGLQAGAQSYGYVVFLMNQKAVDYVQNRGLLLNDSRANMLGGRLALIAPKDSNTSLKIAPKFRLSEALGAKGKLATGDPDYVPVGRYARAALIYLGVWDDVEEKLVRADNVRVALSYVARKEAPLGIVYETDAKIEPNVKIIGIFPDKTHPPILYPIAITKSANSNARGFYYFMRSAQARAIFTQYGFINLQPINKKNR